MWSVITLVLINGMTVQVDHIPNIQYETQTQCVHERTNIAERIGKHVIIKHESNTIMFKDDSRKHNAHICIENPNPIKAQQEITENLKFSGFNVVNNKGKKQ